MGRALDAGGRGVRVGGVEGEMSCVSHFSLGPCPRPCPGHIHACVSACPSPRGLDGLPDDKLHAQWLSSVITSSP